MAAEPIVRAKEVRDDVDGRDRWLWRVTQPVAPAPTCRTALSLRLVGEIAGRLPARRRTLEATVKAVIEIAPRGSVFNTARKHAKGAESGTRLGADYHLSFESARALFSELTPSRIDLLEALRGCGPCSVYAWRRKWGATIRTCTPTSASSRNTGWCSARPKTRCSCRSRRWRFIRRCRSGRCQREARTPHPWRCSPCTPGTTRHAAAVPSVRIRCGATTERFQAAAAHA